MLPLLIAEQIRQADAYTIAHEPISSVDLMERASKAFVGWFINHFPDKKQAISFYCGTGNNGGDGLAIARILHQHQYKELTVRIVRFSDKTSADFDINLERLKQIDIPVSEINKGDDLPDENSSIIIDALLGSGLNKPLTGDYERLVKHINALNKTVVAVDVPTGLFCDGEIQPDTIAIEADLVITFQQPRINFLLPESAPYIHCWEAVNIGIDEKYVQSLNSVYQFMEEKDIKAWLKPRKRFSNKGTYGHALLIAGQAKTMGAALLSSSAAVHAGAGLTTVCVPESGLIALNSYLPEIMAIVRKENKLPEIEWDKFSSIAIGPGLGKDEDAFKLLSALIKNYKKPIVIDADALNLLAEHPELLKKLPEGSVLTPHMKEFDRLFGEHKNWWQRLQTGIEQSKKLNIYIVLKNDYTITLSPEGQAYFNSSGNAAMASGGMGDVLTGIIAALLAQKYTALQACLIGIYIHGKAGDELALPNRLNVALPGKLIVQLPATMAKLMA
ncbi:NAD(P)H-hydrate epimerase [Mucilaginibacter lappiensis]|uniref:Bifunctional NAD(P)H-hydrate repair enzyme n=1 Tax=Mucilaginibacter lappiensis TaxID=354630 RepID=A0ABR6PP54_9SPHI|nr:bifunctional ADP-dependent NAD(P)H-hydrate dehydratase/NAD(P)H-hydrate epimerase [Mucilaginibacter lappiensis]MBB6111560.1 NAD(P)H-hydrate epimerase [Mucilaginibacter lappiensis]SIR85477.1 NAD(P)H-hydrate epimerase [Mucilaginibacter lappiensis]